MPAGRPAKYTSQADLSKAIQEYFDQSEAKPTITGLALHLGFESRQSIYDYEKDGEYSYTIKAARLKIESMYEAKLYEPACTGAIFALKNFGWDDKQTIKHQGDPEQPVIFKLDPRFEG